MRGFSSEALECQQMLEIENTQLEKMIYSTIILHKASTAGGARRRSSKFRRWSMVHSRCNAERHGEAICVDRHAEEQADRINRINPEYMWDQDCMRTEKLVDYGPRQIDAVPDAGLRWCPCAEPA
ncbi:hypothetical protein A0H81_01960 [Grifola frondosa]|uniref:Uncharacterized protein n=1 Tax=Grifola frondosa TaxID=5627 RepID=A0A1C7MTD3_GRIFR|nr:hypothetical protein A0H81_01960 [Grifola frondosa]